ncbi:DEAD/DEAH box helicase family protein [Nonomuraea solani]|uniref:hypothetical protein n=1 Tax=Nonomuraea solani TaxID=1144553 RepID=UPI000CDECDC3|nr:hypothetical protein [Nonomuraea solani]
MAKGAGRALPDVAAIEEAAVRLGGLPDHELAGRTAALRRRATSGESLDELLPEAYALVSEASARTELGRRCSPAELRAAIAMHHGAVAELADRTTWAPAVTLTVCLGALEGRGEHLMTSDASPHTAEVCLLLGLTVGHLVERMDDRERRRAYAADVTVGHVDWFGADHMRDDLGAGQGQWVRRGTRRAVVTDADHVLLDRPFIKHLALQSGGEIVAALNLRGYLRLYDHLAGVSATAAGGAAEFAHLYGLEVEPIAEDRAVTRLDHGIMVFGTADGHGHPADHRPARPSESQARTTRGRCAGTRRRDRLPAPARRSADRHSGHPDQLHRADQQGHRPAW